MRRLLVLFLLLSAAACATPSTVVKTPDTRPALAIEGAPAGAILFLDGVRVGEASTESGEIAGFGSRADYDATLNDRAIAAAISDVIDRLVSRLQDRKWRTDILDVRGGQVFITGGKRQGVQQGDMLDVMEAGDTVKSRQTGFDVTLPPRKVATLRVVSLFGETETDEGAVCEVVGGALPAPLTSKLYVAESTR